MNVKIIAQFNDFEKSYTLKSTGSKMLQLIPSHLTAGVIKLDYDMDWVSGYKVTRFASRPTRDGKALRTKGLPATARAVSGGAEYKDLETVEFTKPLQEFMFRLCRENNPNQALSEAIKDFNSAFWGGRAMCDFAGADSRANYIANTNLNAGAIILKPMLFGGNLFAFDKIVNVAGNGNCYRVQAINVKKVAYNQSNPKPFEDYLKQFHPNTHPHLFFRPTNSVRENYNKNTGKWEVENISEPWHQFGYKMVMPLFSNRDYIFIPVSRGQVLSRDGVIPSPYVFVKGIRDGERVFFENPYN